MADAPEVFDALMVGAGPTGLACGIELKKRGVRTRPDRKGCVVQLPLSLPHHMTFFTTPELLEIGDIPMTSLNEKPTRTEALKYYRRVADHYQLDIHQYERCERITGEDGAFQVDTDGSHSAARTRYSAQKIVLATGYYDIPNRLERSRRGSAEGHCTTTRSRTRTTTTTCGGRREELRRHRRARAVLDGRARHADPPRTPASRAR